MQREAEGGERLGERGLVGFDGEDLSGRSVCDLQEGEVGASEHFRDAGGTGELLRFVVDGDVSAAVDDVPCGDGGIGAGPEKAGGGAIAAGDADDGGLYFVVDNSVELEVCV